MQLEGEQDLLMIESIDEDNKIISYESIPEFQNMPEYKTVNDIELQAKKK